MPAVRAAYLEIGHHEAHVSAEPPPPETDPWIQEAHEHQERPAHLEESPGKGPEAVGCFLTTKYSITYRVWTEL